MNLNELLQGLIANPIDDDLYQSLKRQVATTTSADVRFFELQSIINNLESGELSFLDLDSTLQTLLQIYDFRDTDVEMNEAGGQEGGGSAAVHSPVPEPSYDNLPEDDPSDELLDVFYEEADEQIAELAGQLKYIQPDNAAQLDFNKLFRSAHTIKGSAASVGLKRFSQAIHRFEDFLSRRRDDPHITDFQCESISMAVTLLERIFIKLKRAEDTASDYILAQEVAAALLADTELDQDLRERVQAEIEQKLDRPEEYIRIPVGAIQQLFHEVISLQGLWHESEQLAGKALESVAVKSHERKRYRDLSSSSRRLLNSLQKQMISFQLVPFRVVMPRVRRVVDSYVGQAEKLIDFQMTGLNVEIKKSVVDKLTDILLHLVKNAMDHGLEPPNERRAGGKPETGKIAVRAAIERSQIKISIDDDGRGIDPERIKAKAVAKGIVSTVQADELTRNQVLELLFHPGFSTAESITETSGRGVGMDAVRSMVEDLGGELTMESQPHRGTKMQMCFPSDVTVEEVILIRAGDQRYGLLLQEIESIITLTKEDLESIKDYPFYETAEKLIPIYFLSDLVSPIARGNRTNQQALVLVNTDSKSMALVVDQVVRKMQVIASPPPAIYRRYRHLSALFTTDEGHMCAILHPVDLLQLKQQRDDEVGGKHEAA
jgi:chemotaxis protein histidine kinase CheA